MKGDGASVTSWSLADQPQPSRGTPGGHKRPWAVRERLVTEAIGAEVRRRREAAGMTSYQLAARLCCSQAHVSYLENGRRAVWVPLLWDLADVFGVQPSHFIEMADKAISRFEARGRRALRKGA